MCPPIPLSSDPGSRGYLRAVRDTGSRAHTPSSLEEIEKKLNIYHKGAKIWKMLIFCQVGLSPFVHTCVSACTCGHGGQRMGVLCVPHAANGSFLQGGPGHLYLLKNKVATFAKVEKEEDMIQ